MRSSRPASKAFLRALEKSRQPAKPKAKPKPKAPAKRKTAARRAMEMVLAPERSLWVVLWKNRGPRGAWALWLTDDPGNVAASFTTRKGARDAVAAARGEELNVDAMVRLQRVAMPSGHVHGMRCH